MQVNLTGIEPLFIMRVTLPNPDPEEEDITWLFSTQEIPATEYPHIADFRGLPTWGYVETFGQYQSNAQIEGFGGVQSMEVVCNDITGVFKYILESMNLYDVKIDIFLYVRQFPQAPVCTQLILGKVGGPISWKEGERQVSFNVVAGVEYTEFGFVPEFLDVDTIRNNMNTDPPWPHIFGKVENVSIKPFCKIPVAKLATNVHFLYRAAERRVCIDYDNVVQVYEWPANQSPYANDFNNLFFPNNIGVPELSWPLEFADQLPIESDEYYTIAVPGGYVLFQATAFHGILQVDPAKWNIPWYTNIVCMSPLQYNPMLPHQADDPFYQPNMVMMQGYGTINPDPETWQFNIYDDLILPTTITIGFPPDYPYGTGTTWWENMTNWQTNKNIPWVQGMYIRFLAVRILRDENNEPTTQQFVLWGTVVKQEGIVLYLDDIRTLDSQEGNLTGLRVIYIYEAIQNKIFIPNSMELYPIAPIQTQQSSNDRVQYIDHRYANHSASWENPPDVLDTYQGLFDLDIMIPMGSEIRAVNWWATRLYPVTLDTETCDPTGHPGHFAIAVYALHGRRLLPLDDRSQFGTIRMTKVPIDPEHPELGVRAKWDWFRPDTPPGIWWEDVGPDLMPGPGFDLSPVPKSLWDLSNTNPDYFPDNCTYIILFQGSYLELLKDISEDAVEIRIEAINDYNTDEAVFKFLLEKYTSYDGVVNPDVAQQHPVNFMLRRKEETATGFLAQLAKEHAKAIRVKVNTVNMQDLLELSPPQAFIFDERYIEARSLELLYTEESEILNFMIASADEQWGVPGSIVVKNPTSIVRHQEHRDDGIKILTNRFYDSYVIPPFPPPIYYDPGDPTNPYWVSSAVGKRARGYNRVLFYWLYQRANIWMQYNFVTYLEASDLVAADFATLALTTPLEFQNPAELGVLMYPVRGDGFEHLPNSKGFITEVTIDPSEWRVSISIRLPIMLGGERA
jgi:hypothetical protein